MATKTMDDEQVKRCLELLAQWQASGLDAHTFEQQHLLNPGQLRAWRVHAARWRARLAGQPYQPRRKSQPAGGFIAMKLPGAYNASVRIECTQGARCATVHWPLDASTSCAQWLRQFLA